jgi:hypothetical protein
MTPVTMLYILRKSAAGANAATMNFADFGRSICYPVAARTEVNCTTTETPFTTPPQDSAVSPAAPDKLLI